MIRPSSPNLRRMRSGRGLLRLAAGVVTFAALTAMGPAQAQDAPVCEVNRPVVFAGLDYDSAQFHNAVARYLIHAAFGCEVAEVAGSVIPLVQGMARGEIDINMEIWRDNVTQAWDEAEAAGKVIDLGINFPDAV